MSMTPTWWETVRDQAQSAWTSFRPEQTAALTQLVTPDIGPSFPGKPVVQGLIALCAGGALAGSVLTGAMGVVVALVCAAIIGAILQFVFGIELDVDLPF